MEYFMRPSLVLTLNSNQRAHVELFNPSGSGYYVYLDRLWVSKSSGFTILGKGGPMMDDATFPESRGLPLGDAPPRPYSSAHARMKKTTAPAEVIQGGQWFNQEGVSGLIKFEAPIFLGEGTGLMVRNNFDGEKLMVSFLWHEIAIQETQC